MRMDQINGDGIAIPSDIIHGWRSRKAELDRIIADAQRESTLITRKLEAVAVLVDDESASSDFHLTEPTETVSVISEVAKVLAERKGLMAPKDIRAALRQRQGVPKFSDNYFYTALKRASDKKLIRKVGDRYTAFQNSSPEGGNPEA